MWVLCSSLCVCVHVHACVRTSVSVCVYVCPCDYPCCYQRQAAIHSGWNERFSSVTKQFLCFHGAMILSKSQRKQRRWRGGEGVEKKKINVPHHPTTAGCHHVSTHAYTCIHRQWGGKIEKKKSCICYMNLVIWSWKVKQKFSCLCKQ